MAAPLIDVQLLNVAYYLNNVIALYEQYGCVPYVDLGTVAQRPLRARIARGLVYVTYEDRAPAVAYNEHDALALLEFLQLRLPKLAGSVPRELYSRRYFGDFARGSEFTHG